MEIDAHPSMCLVCVCMCVCDLEDPPRQTERNQSETGPLYPGTPTAR